ncbi:MAG: hypothetical protein GC154_18560 [bacterium]|nr:hypothetical protein [bacterium]
MKALRAFLLIVLCASICHAADEKPGAETVKVHHIQVRVIFADSTGQFGTVPDELRDMRDTLLAAFHYPSFELSNNIRLSTFSDEDVTALVFPDHYLRITPRGEDKSGVKARMEMFYLPAQSGGNTRVYAGGDGSPLVRIDDKSTKDDPLMPILSSAALLNSKTWEAFGGVPVRVTTQGAVNSNTLSSNSLSSSISPMPQGRARYLIVAARLEE